MVNVRELSFNTLEDIWKNEAFSNLKINEVLSLHHLSNVDKGLYTELVYGTIKRKLTLDFYLKPFVQTRLKGWVRRLLWMSIYQYVYLDKIPTHAIIHEAVEIAKKRGGVQVGNTVNAILRQMTSKALPDISSIRDTHQRLSIQYSLPVWIVKHWQTHFGQETTQKIAKHMLEPVMQTVRVNQTRMTVEEAVRQLQLEKFDVKRDEDIDVCLHVSGQPIIQSQLFQDGLISIQDKSSMFVAELMNLQLGDTVLDSCSAPGGKACHMAEILNGQGQVLAQDIHDHKIKLIQHNIDKLQLKRITARQHDATQPIEGTFDKILVDAPCSGLGVLRHKPEIKYTMTPQKVDQLVQIQLEILENVSKNLKANGTLVYSTCTIEQMENENVIYTFLKQHPEFEFAPFIDPKTKEYVKTLQILPQDFNSDGFFITRIRRKGLIL
ncbi:16S rRNA (cytosine(967)-C(5))-methyltransferase RsmB [Staphylococcus felis]|uniref:16S rRNA (cytosine(967)-C(5))-methyltransferase RsmB n=1 Tax=Staphylococcus felis TaxID=46127 RepID=UPI000CD0752B|nr:16S rRNA (cytosine(967)-C(5))-methyltransferase RsmB [Staphylococcus felis]AVP36869.1 16S rRNA (cytosine(967)-C(5))-methyltransferase RsmB [Staphylococcus felis]PNZ35914.1 16S rRNA (cytosine(967)-C(5))-methyltransferase RsmB [Staphylococcus felis]QQB03174.1 16S rRNA (cytosine(967)-C(5))-methyltransferase RsmB [Staphylococcus felis]